MIKIETPEILVDRSSAAYKVMHEAALHADKHGLAEGILVLLLAVTFAAQQYQISPRKLQASIADVRRMITQTQVFTGKEAGIAEVVTEMGLA